MSNASPSNSLVASYSPTNSVSIQSTSYLNPPVSNIVPNGSLSPPSSFSSYSTIPGSAATSTARSTSISYKRELPPATTATNAYSQSFLWRVSKDPVKFHGLRHQFQTEQSSQRDGVQGRHSSSSGVYILIECEFRGDLGPRGNCKC